MMRAFHKGVTVLVTCCAVLLSTSAVRAAEFNQPIHLIVGYPPGGGADGAARIVAQKLSEDIGQQVVVENRPGATGSIAASTIASARPDGYSLLWATSGIPTSVELAYHPVKSFAQISLLLASPDVLVANPSVPANTIQELVSYAKTNPGRLNIASSGVDGIPYIAAKLLMNLTDTDMEIVNYRGGGEPLVAVLGNESQLYFIIPAVVSDMIKNGKLKALAVTTKTRSSILPDVPTVAEALNLPEFDVGEWLGVMAPAGTPPDIVAKLNKAFVGAVNSPAARERLTQLGWEVVASPPEVLTSRLEKDLAAAGKP